MLEEPYQILPMLDLVLNLLRTTENSDALLLRKTITIAEGKKVKSIFSVETLTHFRLFILLSELFTLKEEMLFESLKDQK